MVSKRKAEQFGLFRRDNFSYPALFTVELSGIRVIITGDNDSDAA